MPQPNPSSAPDSPRLNRVPWCTLLTAALAAGVWFWSGASDIFIYDREQILRGELWRAVTGHWVHFSPRHLGLNLLILVPAGLWLERRNASALRRTILLTPAAVSLALFFFAPAMMRYSGLSGVTSAVLVALAIQGLRTEPRAKLVWLGVLVLFGATVAAEILGYQPLYPDLAHRGIASATLAHLVGAAVGGVIALTSRKR